MLLAIQIAASRLLREVPQAPFERMIASCGCAFFKRLWNTASSPQVVFFFLFGFLFLGAKQPVHIGLHSQQLPHFITGLPELAVGFLLFLQQLCVYTIDKRQLERWGREYTAEAFIDELFFSRFVVIGFPVPKENVEG